MTKSVGEIRIGISGWRYAPWRGLFYPTGLPQAKELAYASRVLNSIEINGSFYSLPSRSSWQDWHDTTPDDFVFSVKGPRYITHIRRLQDVRVPLANFVASGVLSLGAKLGPILWQFPPYFKYDRERFEAFFAMLPADSAAALTLAREHDGRVKGKAPWGATGERPLRHAVEIRHHSFVDPEFVDLLRRHHIALVVADTAGRWPLLEELTTDFVYMRLHGDEELYASGYSDTALDRWAQCIDTWRRGGQVDDARRASDRTVARRARRDVYCYFDNDVKVHAPYDAARLSRRLGVPTTLDAEGRFVLPPDLPLPRQRTPAAGKSMRG